MLVCFRPGCESTDLPLATVSEMERITCAQSGIILRECAVCGMAQNHVGVGESMLMEEYIGGPETMAYAFGHLRYTWNRLAGETRRAADAALDVFRTLWREKLRHDRQD
tara:strand:+ start:4236 stop:4562 length:327 start_codon:yes stop_codon:yes gene_type:complete